MPDRILERSAYCTVYGILVFLTLLTVGISFIELGPWHLAAGLAIGACKALLVALFFMHVLDSSRLTQVVIAGAILWLGILMTLTMSDYLSRGWLAY